MIKSTEFFPAEPLGKSALKQDRVSYDWAEGDQNDRPDFVSVHNSVLSVTKDLYSELSAELDLCANTISLRIGADQYCAIIPLREIDLFDPARSIFRQVKSGAITGVKKVAITKSLTGEPDMFRLSGEMGIRMLTLVSDKFKDYVQARGLTGLRFDEAKIQQA